MFDGNVAPVAEVHVLSKSYGTRSVLDTVSFVVDSGEIVALLGPNGAGKTTLIGCLLGVLAPSAGGAKLFGVKATELSPALRSRIGFVPQAMTGFTWFRVGELIRYLGRFYRRDPGDPPAWLLEWAQLDLNVRVKSLSGGQKQRLAVLLALRHEPDLLILDEPVASLDPQARRDFMLLLGRYCAERGGSAIISSHILSDLEKIATRALFLRHGTIIHDTPMARFRESTRWVSASCDFSTLRAALPDSLAILSENRDDGTILVDGWSEAVANAVTNTLHERANARAPDLETAFLEMMR